MPHYNWAKLPDNKYCSLNSLALENVQNTKGVYVIWQSLPYPRTIRLGQGYIGQRLSAHRLDKEVMAYQSQGEYYASWITPPAAYLDGIERYLAEKLKPLVGDAFPVAAPIEVNLP